MDPTLFAPPWSPRRAPSRVLDLSASSLTLANGDPISTCLDASGAGNNATQSGAARPTYLASWINGQPAMAFSGTQWLAVASTLTSDKPWTVALVAQWTTITGQRYAFATGEVNGYGLGVNGGGTGKREIISKGVLFDTDDNATTDAEQWVATRDSGNNLVLYVNGAAKALANPSPGMSAPDTSSAVGALRSDTGAMPFIGRIGRLVVSTVVWDATTIGSWNKWVRRIYGIG